MEGERAAVLVGGFTWKDRAFVRKGRRPRFRCGQGFCLEMQLKRRSECYRGTRALFLRGKGQRPQYLNSRRITPKRDISEVPTFCSKTRRCALARDLQPQTPIQRHPALCFELLLYRYATICHEVLLYRRITICLETLP